MQCRLGLPKVTRPRLEYMEGQGRTSLFTEISLRNFNPWKLSVLYTCVRNISTQSPVARARDATCDSLMSSRRRCHGDGVLTNSYLWGYLGNHSCLLNCGRWRRQCKPSGRSRLSKCAYATTLFTPPLFGASVPFLPHAATATTVTGIEYVSGGDKSRQHSTFLDVLEPRARGRIWRSRMCERRARWINRARRCAMTNCGTTQFAFRVHTLICAYLFHVQLFMTWVVCSPTRPEPLSTCLDAAAEPLGAHCPSNSAAIVS